jgi:hypothetical protein
MPRRRLRFASALPVAGRLPIVAALVLLALPARRAFAVVDSLEAMVADADVVAVAVPLDVWRVKEQVQGPRGRATIRLLQQIKGRADNDVTLVLPSFCEADFRAWAKQGTPPRVVFLVRSDRAPWHPPDPDLPLAVRTFGWSLGEGAGFTRAPRVDWRVSQAITLDMHVIYDPAKALEAVRAAAARTVGDAVRYEELEVPKSSGLLEVRPDLLSEGLRVPVDDRSQAAAWKWADDPAYALPTAAILGHFDSERNVAILKRLANHPEHVASGRPGKSVTWSYPVRQRAYAALQRWGSAPASVAARGPDDFYRAIQVRHGVMTCGALVALALTYWVLRRRRRRAATTTPEYSVAAPEPRRFPFVSILLAAATGVLLWLALTSDTTVHELTATVGDARYWVSTYRGGIQFVRIPHWPQRHALAYGRFPLADAPGSLWNEQDVISSYDFQFAGFRRLTGLMWGDWQGTTYPYGSVTVPAALVAALLGALPAWHTLAVLRDRSRRRARLLRGCCVACGYDLHGIRSAERCPECGTPAALKA